MNNILRSPKYPKVLLFVLVVLSPATAHANAGLPMLCVNLPVLVLLILPVIAIEVAFLAYKINQPIARIFMIVSLSNFVTTFVGVPTVWALMILFLAGTNSQSWLFFGFSTFWEQTFTIITSFPWLFPFKNIKNHHVAFAASVLHIAFFFISYWIEKKMSVRMLKGVDENVVKRRVLLGNIATYSLLIPATVLLIYIPESNGIFNWMFQARVLVFGIWFILLILTASWLIFDRISKKHINKLPS